MELWMLVFTAWNTAYYIETISTSRSVFFYPQLQEIVGQNVLQKFQKWLCVEPSQVKFQSLQCYKKLSLLRIFKNFKDDYRVESIYSKAPNLSV